MSKVPSNSPCPCGSGKKYKHCCGSAATQKSAPVADTLHEFRQFVHAGLAAQQRGALAEADSFYDEALRLIPTDPGVLGLKAMRLCHDGRYEAALPLLQQALTTAPDEPRLHELLGQALLGMHRHIEAERAFGQALRLAPDDLAAWKGIAQTQLAHSKLQEAVASFREVIRRQPSDAAAHFYSAQALYYLGELDAAEQAWQAAERLGSHPAVVGLWRSALARRRGLVEVSLTQQAQAEAAFPHDDALLGTLLDIGRRETESGQFAAAEYWLLRAIALHPEGVAAYVQLANARKFSETDQPLVDRMEGLLAMPSLTDADREGLEFALGKVWSDLKEPDRAFAHYQAGNDLVRARVPYAVSAKVAVTSWMMTAFSKQNVASLPAGNDSDLPVLIVGLPRSGTTLTEQIVSSHSQVAGAGEMDFWPRLAPQVLRNFPAGCSPAIFSQLAEGYWGLLRQESPTALRVTDKMPGNFNYLGLIHAVFPKARIIHVRRHPIDTCLSIYFQQFKDSHAYKWDLESLASYYEQYHRLMAHWHSILPAKSIFELQYEELVEDTEGVSKRLMDFIGLDWEPGQLEFHRQDRAVFTMSKWQAKQPIYKTSKERWRQYEKHLGPLLRLQEYA